MFSLNTMIIHKNAVTKVMVKAIFLFSLLDDVLSSSLTREVLASCIYWDEFDIDLCYPGFHRCNDGSDCCPCPAGTFMTWYNKCPQCLPFRDCYGQKVLFPGNYVYDRICGDIPVSTESVPSEATKATSNPPSSPKGDEQEDESMDEKKSVPPNDPPEPPDDESDPSDDLDVGTPSIKLDLHTLELVIILILSVISGGFALDKLCRCVKPCRCRCDICRDCTGSDRRGSRQKLPQHESREDSGTVGLTVVSSESAEKKTKANYQRQTSNRRGRKRSTQVPS